MSGGIGKVIVAYYGSWASYRAEPATFAVHQIRPNCYTHLIYAFAILDESKNSIVEADAWLDIQKDNGMAGYKGAIALKKRNPKLKVSIAIGGWNDGSTKYSKMAANPSSRTQFIQSVLAFLKKHHFDGLDLDWEYPGLRGGKPEDKQNFVSLVKELKEAFQPHNYLLTAAIGAGEDTVKTAYDLPSLNKYLDFIHVMTYDYYTSSGGIVGPNAPLDRVKQSVNFMLSNGVSASKLVMGVGFYGQCYVLDKPGRVEMGSSKASSTFPGPLIKQNGFMGYNEISHEMAKNENNWTRKFCGKTETTYMISRDGAKVVCYDGREAIKRKASWAKHKGLRGIMIWSIDTDGQKGLLIRTVRENFLQ